MTHTVEEKFKKLITEGKKRSHDNGIDRKLQLCNFDEEKIDLGCQTFQRHFFSMFVSMLAGLLSLLYIPTIVKVLFNTGVIFKETIRFASARLKYRASSYT